MRWLLLSIVGCAPGSAELVQESESVPAVDSAGEPSAPADPVPVDKPEGVQLWLSSPANAMPPGGDQTHATVAMRPFGHAMVFYTHVGVGMRSAKVEEDGRVMGTSLDLAAHHPQVRTTNDGWAVVATAIPGTGLVAAEFDGGGRFVGGELLSVTHNQFADLDFRDDGELGVVVSTDFEELQCTLVNEQMEFLELLPCPKRVIDGSALGTVSSITLDNELVVAWTELLEDGALSVYMAKDGELLYATTLADGAGLAGRPMISGNGVSIGMAFRGAPLPDAPIGSFFMTFAHGVPYGGPYRLGSDPHGGDIDLPTVVGPITDIYLVAYEENGEVMLQARELDGRAAGEPLQLSEAGGARPSLSVVPSGDGFRGIASWETEGSDGLHSVSVRLFEGLRN